MLLSAISDTNADGKMLSAGQAVHLQPTPQVG